MATKGGGKVFGVWGFFLLCFVFVLEGGRVLKIAFSVFTKHYLYFYQSTNHLST